MASIGFIIDQIKHDPACILRSLPTRQVCQQLKIQFRDRCLDPATTVALFVQQVIEGNCSCAAMRHRDGRVFTPQAYCKARQRLPLAVLTTLGRKLREAAGAGLRSHGELFLTRRVFVIDGSSISMSDTPALQAYFGQPGAQKAGCGFPVAHLLALFDVNSGMLLEAIASPMRTHDLRHAASMHPLMREGDLLLGDTGFCSYTHFALLLEAKVHGLMPSHQCRIIDFTPHRPFVAPDEKVTDQNRHLARSRWIKSLGKDDQLVEWFKPQQKPKYMSKKQFDALPASIVVRELRRRVWREELNAWTELVIVTTLLDPQLDPAGKLVELRLRRWTVEVNLRHLKTTMGLDVLKCRSVEGIRKELAVFGLVYNAVRLLMLQAAGRQKTTADRISFKDVLRWLSVARAGQPMPHFIINPRRHGRIEPRAVKRRPKEYDRLNRPRAQMRNALKTRGRSA